MSSKVEELPRTVCIAPEDVERVLPYVICFINDAVERCGDWTLAEVVYLLQGAQALLWVIWDGENFAAAAISQLIKVPRGKVCQVIACGGAAESWPNALRPVEEYAKAENCIAMRIQGRPGWSRLFSQHAYKTQWHSLEKAI
jgi:hypothetical protein